MQGSALRASMAVLAYTVWFGEGWRVKRFALVVQPATMSGKTLERDPMDAVTVNLVCSSGISIWLSSAKRWNSIQWMLHYFANRMRRCLVENPYLACHSFRPFGAMHGRLVLPQRRTYNRRYFSVFTKCWQFFGAIALRNRVCVRAFSNKAPVSNRFEFTT